MDDDNQHNGSMRPTGWRLPLGIIVVGAAIAYLVVDLAYGSVPLLVPWTAIPTLALLAVGEGITAWHTRRRIRRATGTTPIEPLSAARLVALAKASALFGALAVGVFGGAALALLDRLNAASARADAITCAGTLAAGGLLLAAGLLLEHACRVPPEDEEPPPGRGPVA
ncbi:DUF3180 domain-containing protein [Nocardiopsis sediminis]|uniref:DUF3180 domain-containing protein n=1 Tax=Nocardiopsis sediminis TaxID=1778267 RepID=A0ABV8FIX0_9ACTN